MPRILGYDLSGDEQDDLYNVTVLQHIKKQEHFEQVGYLTMTDNERIVEALTESGVKVHHLQPEHRPQGRVNLWRRTLFLLGMFLLAGREGYRKVHLFHLDSNVFSLLLLLPFAWRIHVTGTLHGYPEQWLKRMALLLLLKLGIVNKVVVHGNYTHQKMLMDGLDESKVANIHIPYFKRHSLESSGQLEKIRRELSGRRHPLFLCLGTLNYEKGIDVLLESLTVLRDYEFTVIVAGPEGDYTQADLDRMAEHYGVRDKLYLDIRHIPERVKQYYFEQCHAVVLPHRRMYTGLSSPLAEAAAHRKFIVGPRYGEMGYTIDTYLLGATFKAENPEDLADKMKLLLHRMKEAGKPPAASHMSIFAQMLRNEKLFGERYGRFLA
ncbi:glycosyltransferase [Cohnella pontilimi]|nr:glycosyltransferase [Cohnella pontilimi]